MTFNIRPATETDIDAITAIYAHHVLHGTGTFELDPPNAAEMGNRFAKLTAAGYPFLVAESGGEVVGYGYLGPFRERRAYRFTVEDSVYVHPDHVRKGIGSQLLTALIEAAKEGNYTQLVALIGDSENKASIALHERAGFERTGIMRNTGYKFDRWLDVVIMQLTLK